MKKIITLLSVVALVLLGGLNVYAQSKSSKSKTKPQPVKLDPMLYKGGKFIVGYDVIPQENYRNYFNPDEFLRVNQALKMRKAGIGCMIAGGSTIVVGAAVMGVGLSMYFSANEQSKRELGNYIWVGGVAGMSAGAALMGTGIPLYCIGDNRLKDAAAGYNQRNNIKVSLNLSPYGPGLSLNF